MASLFGGKTASDRKDRKGKPQRTLSETLDLLFFASFAAFLRDLYGQRLLPGP
jgi:hypothetical protein